MTHTTDTTDTNGQDRPLWMRGLMMLVFLVLFGLAESVLAIMAFVQFFWRAITGEANGALQDFGVMLGEWTSQVSRFQSMRTEDAPFPWGDWPKSE